MNIDAFVKYFLNRNDIEWGDVKTLKVSEFQNNFTSEIRKHLNQAEVSFSVYELEQLTDKLWKKLK